MTITLKEAARRARESSERAERERLLFVEEDAARHYDYVTVTSSPPCEHQNGWWTSIPSRVLLFFTTRRRVFVCEDCLNILEAETMERV